jgi:putative ABC transport system permease protein
MMLHSNVSLAWSSIKRAKLRNLLTMFGIIIGVISVVTTLSIGQGLKSQVNKQINNFGSDLLIVRPGSTNLHTEAKNLAKLNLTTNLNTSTLTSNDVDAVINSPGVKMAAPLSVVNGVPTYEDRQFPSGLVMGTNSHLADILNQKIEFGEFLSDADEGKYFAVVGKDVAEQLFQKNVPIGRSINFRGKLLIVKGVFKQFDSNPLALGTDLNNAILVPYTTSQQLSEGSSQAFQILAKPNESKDVDKVQHNIEQSLQRVHAGEKDFSVLKQDETLATTNSILNLVTAFIAGVAGVSILVGGVGIMNVMLVSVTERTHEIGIRKAVGATNRQIMTQFLIEAMMLSVVGSIIGIIISLIIGFLLRIFTNLIPVISFPIMGGAIVVSVLVGVIFGVTPAFKAARKDPIRALRNEL